MAFTKLQPVDGETVLTCSHLDGKHHWFALAADEQGKPHEIKFMRPDGSTGEARFATLCDSCFQKYHDNPAAVIRGDGVWQGDAPFVEDITN